MRTSRKKANRLPASHDWRTTDTDEIEKRRQRARDESFTIKNIDTAHPIFSNFAVTSKSGLTYSVELRGLEANQCACDCVDFRINGLGTCKHVEAVRIQLRARHGRLFKSAMATGSGRVEVVVDRAAETLRLVSGGRKAPRAMRQWFDGEGLLAGEPETVLAKLRSLRNGHRGGLRISQEVAPWLESRRQVEESRRLRREYELKAQSGEWPAQETTVPLFPYQREGMLHLAFTERALLADEMGLGKTIQAIAACALLHRLGQARRVLVVTPASLKSEWEEQIRRFTTLELRILFGGKRQRLEAYEAAQAPFFTIVNYEQIVQDAMDINARMAPDVVVLDEAQRIKNWNTKTAQSVKRLRSRYAFVLTGTPIENRIDELHSLMDFLNPSVLGPLFRFNRDFYDLDERGRPAGLRNLGRLHERVKPYMLRRRKAEVETELPERTDRNHFVKMDPVQLQNYAFHEQHVMRLAYAAKRRPLTPPEQAKLQRELAMMRMICDTNYILDSEDRTCPKLAELEKVLEECADNEAKVIVFSEWERMLQLVRDSCEERGIGYAWHTGSVPQSRRRAEINAFKNDSNCRVFLSTDSGAAGLNLQTASVVINCDLPWNPAKLEQRVARAWRKHQTKPVTVVNLISEDTIEHRMLDTLALKQTVAASVLDRPGEVDAIAIRGGRQALVERLQQLVTPLDPSRNGISEDGAAKRGSRDDAARAAREIADPAAWFARRAAERLNGALVRCEERFPQGGSHTVIVAVVDRDANAWREALARIHGECCVGGRVDPLAPVQLEVMDRETDAAIERLIGAGILARSFRAARPLFPAETAEPEALSEEERRRIREQREHAERRLKMGRLLGGGGFEEEARMAMSEAILAWGRVLALEGRHPEPGELMDVLQPPVSRGWGGALPLLKEFAKDAGADWKPVWESVHQAVQSQAREA